MAASYYRDHPYNNPSRHDRYSSGYRAEPARPDDSSDSYVEEIDREFPPGSQYRQWTPDNRELAFDRRGRGKGPLRSRSVGGRDGSADYYYSHREGHRPSRRHRRRHRSPSRSSSSSRSPTPRPRARRHKSFGEQALEAVGLGGAAGALTGKHHRDRSDDDYDRRNRRGDDDYRRSRRHDRYSSPSSSSRSRRHSRSKSSMQSKHMRDMVGAALAAGAAEAFHARKEPGGWTGAKGKRIVTAAITAGGTDKLLDGHSDKHSKRHMIESTIAGLATNHLINGPRSKSRSRHGRRTRSEHRGGGKDLASAGLLAAAGKKAYDHYKSRSRGRSPHSGYSSDESSRSRRPRVDRKRSKSVSDYVNKGIAALGLNESRRRIPSPSDYDDYSDGYRDSRRHRDVGQTRSLSLSGSGDPRAYQYPNRDHGPDKRRFSQTNSDYCSDSDSDLGVSSDEERTRKKMLGKEVLTAGLATIATIHAGHEVFQSAQARKKRMEQLRDGEISPEEALKQRRKGNLKDAASISLAALGIKGTVDEWKKTAAHHSEYRSYNQKCKDRAQKRARRRSMSMGDGR